MDMGKIVKRSVEKQGMLAWQFNTIGVSDGITMGSEGTSTQALEGYLPHPKTRDGLAPWAIRSLTSHKDS